MWFKNGLKAQKLLAQGIALGIIERIDVARATECLWGRCRISECLDVLSTVVG